MNAHETALYEIRPLAIKVSIVRSDGQKPSKVSGRGLSHYLLSEHFEMLGPSMCQANILLLSHCLSPIPYHSAFYHFHHIADSSYITELPACMKLGVLCCSCSDFLLVRWPFWCKVSIEILPLNKSVWAPCNTEAFDSKNVHHNIWYSETK